MVPIKSHSEREDFARRGDEIFERHVNPSLRPDQERQFVAIDVDSADFEVDPDQTKATQRLLQRRPAARVWWRRIGQRAVYRIGPSRTIKR